MIHYQEEALRQALDGVRKELPSGLSRAALGQPLATRWHSFFVNRKVNKPERIKKWPPFPRGPVFLKTIFMIRKLKSGQYRIYSRKKDTKTNKRKNLGTFDSLEAARKHEREIQYFKHG